MATPTRVVWARDPHTAAKHDLLRRYFAAWLPVLFQRYSHLTYAEGFAGPGVYEGGEPGSPVIALEVIASHQSLLARHPTRVIDVVFIEEHPGRHDRLVRELGRAKERLGTFPSNVRLHPPVLGDCVTELPRLLTELDAWGSPMLVVLDSFGGPDIPFELVRSIAQSRSSEALVTFAPTFLTRYGENPQHTESGDRAFGDQDWRGVFEQPPQRKRAYLVDAYRESLRKAGFTSVLSFEMVDEGGHQLWLMFGTNNPKGVEKMKDAMWRVDPAYGVRYRDPRDLKQMTLDIKERPNTTLLSRMLLNFLADGPHTLEELRTYTLHQTVYRPQQVRPVVQGLLREGRITRVDGGQLSGSSLLSLARGGGQPPSEQPPLFDL